MVRPCSPWIRRSPQVGLSRVISSAKSRTVRGAGGAYGTTMRVAPAALDYVGAPAQQGMRRNDQAKLAAVPMREQLGQRGNDRTVGLGRSGCLDVALEHGDLVAQDQDLGVFGHV